MSEKEVYFSVLFLKIVLKITFEVLSERLLSLRFVFRLQKSFFLKIFVIRSLRIFIALLYFIDLLKDFHPFIRCLAHFSTNFYLILI